MAIYTFMLQYRARPFSFPTSMMHARRTVTVSVYIYIYTRKHIYTYIMALATASRVQRTGAGTVSDSVTERPSQPPHTHLLTFLYLHNAWGERYSHGRSHISSIILYTYTYTFTYIHTSLTRNTL